MKPASMRAPRMHKRHVTRGDPSKMKGMCRLKGTEEGVWEANVPHRRIVFSGKKRGHGYAEVRF